jgi:hypothetical protein
MPEQVNLCEQHTEQLKDHETRIQDLEKKDAVMSMKLDTTNKILYAIATMLAGGIIGLFFDFLKR